jgi:hypothetical protein
MFVTQNARARALGEDRAGTFNGYEARSALASELFELANRVNPAVPFPPDAGTAGQPICVEERELQRVQMATSESNQPPTRDSSGSFRGFSESPKGATRQAISPLFVSPPRLSPQSPKSPPSVGSPPICSPRPAIPDLGRLSIQRTPPLPPSFQPAPPTTPRPQGRSVGRRHVVGFEYARPTTRRMSSRSGEQAGRDGNQVAEWGAGGLIVWGNLLAD